MLMQVKAASSLPSSASESCDVMLAEAETASVVLEIESAFKFGNLGANLFEQKFADLKAISLDVVEGIAEAVSGDKARDLNLGRVSELVHQFLQVYSFSKTPGFHKATADMLNVLGTVYSKASALRSVVKGDTKELSEPGVLQPLKSMISEDSVLQLSALVGEDVAKQFIEAGRGVAVEALR